MARIVVYSMGYRGDVFPYVPIASTLARRGHDVTFVAPREFHPLFAAEPFVSAHSGTDFGPEALDQHGDYVARWGMRLGGVLLLRLYFGTFCMPHLPELFGAIDEQVATADVVVAHPTASLISAMSCERHDVPWVVGDLFPMLNPTNEAPPAGMPNFGRRANATIWSASRSRRAERMSYGGDFRAFRTKLGLPDEHWNVIDARLSPFANAGLASKHYVERRSDWPANYELVGFTAWNGPHDGKLDDDVQRFLDAGDPPVLVTMGTSAASANPDAFCAIADALDAAKRRGLFCTSNLDISHQLLRHLGAHTAHGVWPFVPLVPVLPRTAAIVHSGSHGTNALALSAGVPSVVMPCLFDQRWHAQRQVALGTGIWARNVRDVENAIARVLHDDRYGRAAHALAAKIATEDGVARVCDTVETLV